MKLLAPFILLGLLALIAKHPITGLALVFLICVWPVIKWVGRLWLEAFILSKGVKASHMLDVEAMIAAVRA